MCSHNETWHIAKGDFPAAAKAREAFRKSLERLSSTESDLDGAEIIFGELVTNALRYSDGAASAELACRGEGFTLEIRDTGRGFDPATIAGGARRGDAEGGRGLMIARRLATNLDVVCSNEGCVVAVGLPAVCPESTRN